MKMDSTFMQDSGFSSLSSHQKILVVLGGGLVLLSYAALFWLCISFCPIADNKADSPLLEALFHSVCGRNGGMDDLLLCDVHPWRRHDDISFESPNVLAARAGDVVVCFCRVQVPQQIHRRLNCGANRCRVQLRVSDMGLRHLVFGEKIICDRK
jgi:hypothetical protein